ncbi:MAG: polysaccharide pyruvyl transferase family protein [Anaerostipes sp.]|uniref:polysaccharide pyruvyl transferase family protein n=1 Tax=Anaerostipes sp. TaxID=1872530 RepID=UPI003993AE61
MKKILMFGHGGSRNHGCEAIVKATCELLKNKDAEITLLSSRPEEDKLFLDESIIRIQDEKGKPHKNLEYMKAILDIKLKKSFQQMDDLVYKSPFEFNKKDSGIALSIGGDNYCYNDHQRYIKKHQFAKKCGWKTVLWGCSIDEQWLDIEEILDDLRKFDLIYTRETLTYNAMKKRGLKNLILAPDVAFRLPVDEEMDLLPKDNTIGLNLSPYVIQDEASYENVIQFIRYILDETAYNISLIPHVCWENISDFTILSKIKKQFENNERVILVKEFSCNQIKKYISKLRFLIAARTHASIAGYSTYVPTLVLGYSVKSMGIAKDIFGDYSNYVVEKNRLSLEKDCLIKSFLWMEKHEMKMKKYLSDFIPNYIIGLEKINNLI